MKTRTFDNFLSPVSLEENREVGGSWLKADAVHKRVPPAGLTNHRLTRLVPLRMLRDLVISPDNIIPIFFCKVLLNPSYFNTPCSSFSHMFLEMLFPSTFPLMIMRSSWKVESHILWRGHWTHSSRRECWLRTICGIGKEITVCFCMKDWVRLSTPMEGSCYYAVFLQLLRQRVQAGDRSELGLWGHLDLEWMPLCSCETLGSWVGLFPCVK